MILIWLLLCFALHPRQWCLAFSITPAAKSTALSLSSSSSDLATTRGISSLKEWDVVAAIRHLKEAIFLDENNGDAHYHLGRSYRRQKDLARASTAFRRASELNVGPSCNNEALFELGNVLEEMGYVEEAVDVFRKLISTSQSDANEPPYIYELCLANVLLDGLGEKTEPLAIYKRSSVGLTLTFAGAILDSMRDHDAAEEFYEQSSDTQNLEEVIPETALYWMLSMLRRGEDAGAAILKGRLLDYVRTSAEYVLSTPLKSLNPSIYYLTYDMIQLALQNSRPMKGGLILEFGVYHGKTIRMIASHFPDRDVHGFDTFTGIPEDWHLTPSGSYSTHGAVPSAPDNVSFHVGLFSQTLPSFLEQHDGPVEFMNVDCDLYSSTRDIFDAVYDRIVPGSIIVFDEYVMNPNWEKDEYKAFQETVLKRGWGYEYIAISLITGQAIVRITDTCTTTS